MRPVPIECIMVGQATGWFRTVISRRQGRVTRTKSGHESGVFDVASAVGEAWFLWEYADRRRWTWSAVGSDKTVRDVGPCEVQVALAPNRNFVVRRYDLENGVPPETPYVLIQLERCDDGWWLGEICGYIPLGEALEHPDRRPMIQNGREIDGVWLLGPESLYPMPASREVGAR